MDEWPKILLGVAVVFVAFFVNGVVATIEDELPGGFNNPHGDQPLSPFSRRWLRIGGAIAVIVLAPLAVVATRSAFLDARLADRLLDAGFGAGAAALSLAIVLKRRVVVWAGAALIGAGLASALILR